MNHLAKYLPALVLAAATVALAAPQLPPPTPTYNGDAAAVSTITLSVTGFTNSSQTAAPEGHRQDMSDIAMLSVYFGFIFLSLGIIFLKMCPLVCWKKDERNKEAQTETQTQTPVSDVVVEEVIGEQK